MFFHIRLHDFPVSRRTAELRNQHRAYLGGFAGNLIGRGAVQSEDGSTPRGSIFFGDWADRAAVEKFMAEEPFNRNGVYMSAEIVRWSNVLELKPGTYTGREGPDLFYIRGYPKPGMDAKRESLLKEHGDYLAAAEPKIVVRGGCFSDDGKQWQGSVMVVRLPDRAAADRFAAEEPFCRNGLLARVVVERCGLAGPEHK